MLRVSTINYAAPPPGCFWKWSVGFDAIEWRDNGSTLTLWPEVHTVLERFGTGNGLPRFGSLLLLMAACRQDWPETAPRLRTVFATLLAPETPGPDVVSNGAIDSLLELMDTVHRLPRELRSGPAALCHLATAVFEGGPYSISEKESELILSDLALAGPASLAGTSPGLSAKAQLLRDCRALLTGLKRHDARSLENLLRTGLEDTALQPAELTPALAEKAGTGVLLDTLAATGGESGAVAAVARRAIAMMNFPGHLSSPPDLPVGGIADITNRGTIDRLLPGELAWDDLVLAARLVHNEALYFRREIPPMNVAVSHTVLLSRELRLWGQGRVLSLGVALGLRHHPALNGPGQSFECVAATVEDFDYLELETPADVAAALEVLVPHDGPLQLLQTWWAAAQQLQDPALPDVSLILAAESLEDAPLQRLLGDVATWLHGRGGQLRTLALSRDGGLEILAWSPAGNRSIFRGELQPAPVVQPSKSEARPASPPPGDSNPLAKILPIYAREPLPLIFPYRAKPGASIRFGTGETPVHIGVSVEGHLMRWTQDSTAGELLSTKLPGQQHWLGAEGGQPIVITSASKPGAAVQVFRWDGHQLCKIAIETPWHSFPRYSTVSGGAVILAYANRAEALSLATGKRVAELEYPALFKKNRFNYDGHRILHEEGEPASSDQAELSFETGKDRPVRAMLTPDRVMMARNTGAVRIGCGPKIREFNRITCSWRESLNLDEEGFVPLIDSDLSSPGGGLMKRAVLSEDLEIWYDPLGLLHLRPFLPDFSPWTLLLSEPSASAWNQGIGLLAQDPSLSQRFQQAPFIMGSHLFSNLIEALKKLS